MFVEFGPAGSPTDSFDLGNLQNEPLSDQANSM